MFISPVGNEPQIFHMNLARFNRSRTSIGIPVSNWEQLEHAAFEMRLLEGRLLEELRLSILNLTIDVVQDAYHFVSWFESLINWGPGQYHPLFDWLADSATKDQLKWFLTQEAAGEAGFEDLIAYSQS